MSYEHVWEYMRAVPSLVANGATLEDIYTALESVDDPTPDRFANLSDPAARIAALARTWTQVADFVPLRLRELFDDLELDHSDDYVLAMVGHLDSRHEPGGLIEFFLRHDTQLREQIFWRIFEVEGGGEISLTNIETFTRTSWRRTVVDLADEGVLDRARVLRSCLEALNRDFSSYRAQWFAHTYKALQPTADEIRRDQDALCAILGSGVSASVSMAIAHLAAIEKKGLLDIDAFTASCTPALTGTKSAAVAAIRILRQASGEDVADALAAALENPHADVQMLAAKELLSRGREDLVRAAEGIVAPTVAQRVGLGIPSPDDDQPPDDRHGFAPQPIDPWLDGEAVDRFAELIDGDVAAIDFEGALAWLAQTSDPATALAPLTKRARKRLASAGAYPAALVLAVTDGRKFRGHQDAPPSDYGTSTGSPIPVFDQRIHEVLSIAAGRQARRPLLAYPTDNSGVISPAALVERYVATLKADCVPFPHDLTQALLRLAADGGTDAAAILRSHRDLAPAGRVLAALEAGDAGSSVTPTIAIEWKSKTWSWEYGEDTGTATAWWPDFRAERKVLGRMVSNPGLIRSQSGRYAAELHPLLIDELRILYPRSTVHLAAHGLKAANDGVQMAEARYSNEHFIAALRRHCGTWSDATAQVLALGLSAKRAEVRVAAAELFVESVPHRYPPSGAAAAMATCHRACVLTRWATSLSDAASISTAGAVAVVETLTALLPRIERSERGVGKLIEVLLNESLRLDRPVVNKDLREWLGGFSGSSAAARYARELAAGGS